MASRRTRKSTQMSLSYGNMPAQIFAILINIFIDTKCPLCLSSQVKYPASICPVCEEQFFRNNILLTTSTKYVKKIFSFFRYEGIFRKYIHAFKYYQTPYSITLSEEIIRDSSLKDLLKNISTNIIIPVPLHRIKYRYRGFNQSETFANLLGKKTGLPVSSHNLIKIKNTVSQTSLKKKERMTNLKNAFSVLHPFALKDRNVVLVDDIITTGTTLEMCGYELLKAGVKSVSAVTLARTLHC